MSTDDQEPAAPSFERVRKLAKQITRDARAGDAAALKRVQAQLPKLAALDPATAAATVKLADVQHALAREAGLEHWAAFKAFLQAQEPLAQQIARFLRALPEGDGTTMRRVLDAWPQVARTSVHAACAACDREAVEAWLARDPANATARFADTDWTPLDCLAASPLWSADDAHRAASVAIGERLLALGADPNHATKPPGGGEGSLSVLYRASELGNAGLVQRLLDRGANPNDGESTYHAAERNHRDVLDLLLAHGAELSATHQPWNNTILYFLAGYRDDQAGAGDANAGMEWLLAHGADPDVPSGDQRETPLHRVAGGGRGGPVARLLLDHGADPNRARADGRTAWELAMRVGNTAVAELLRARGAAIAELRPVDRVLHACATGDVEAAKRLLDAHAGPREELLGRERHTLFSAAWSGAPGAVEALVALGVDLGVEGPWGGSALHWAAWHGRADAVRALLAAGAPLDLRDRTYGSSPIAWAAHGSANCRDADDDYVAVIDLLLARKPDRSASYNKWNEPPENLASDAVADHLRVTGFAPES